MFEVLMEFWGNTGYANLTWQHLVMLTISCILLYLAIGKKFEPLLLVPIAFGMLLTNLPFSGLMDIGDIVIKALSPETAGATAEMLKNPTTQMLVDGIPAQVYTETPGGLLNYFYMGNKLGIFPPLIFLGVGAMTDFGPLIANPKSLFLGAAAQFGIFFTFTGAILMGFNAQEASSIGIIGGADGPTAIFLTSRLAPHLLGPIAVAAYSYMALVPIIQPPIMKALTSKQERMIKMEQLRPVSKEEKIIFPILVTIVVSLLLPSATALVGLLMFGNLLKESLVTDRLSKTAQNELINIVTILLGVSVGATAKAEHFLKLETIQIIVLGVIAFAVGTATGVILAKIMNKLMGGNAINPLIGSAGVSAVPMAARVSQTVGQKENPSNFLLMHAMGPNVAGVIGSAVAAGVLLSLF
ncbi:sodium ion-translocating decarboxylase subunit beta [Alkaliphilus peptidifermentans]|uniref:Oxaloacetate decarboxylase, beta subunit n=2 Tax=Alkaliphilus TaxID=114627 RepID=A0A1G5KI08_9FIRM|nr:sodium ion-translocating decarboxylase subunit beta [Alkaliphilus peptidifermentans]SCY99688.1 oxaloacetate decarboxylase, beta subunit [Alkaliphilus peptidifermentans DSM 18978]